MQVSCELDLDIDTYKKIIIIDVRAWFRLLLESLSF